MEILGLKVFWLGHSSFKIEGNVNIYIDPFQIKFPKEKDGDIVLITHDHFDHCSLDDIKKIIHNQSVIISSKMCRGKIENLKENVAQIFYVEPGEIKNVNNVIIQAVPSYNVNKFRSPGKVFHPKEMKYVGYIIKVNNVRVYHTGDSDVIPEMKDFGNIDIALLPVSGTYVMTAEEALEAVKILRPKVAIPMHFGSIVGSEKDAEIFEKLASQLTQVIIPKKE